MTTINVFLTKDSDGSVELWKSKPAYNDEIWTPAEGTDEVGTEIMDELLDTFVKAGECISIQISKL